MKAALYLRVSTVEQTTDNQLIELESYCNNNNIEVFKVYKDEGVSGAKTSRPALDTMLHDMRQKLFDTIVVWKFDRLGRSTIHLMQVLEEMKSKGIRLIATTQNIDTETSMGKFFFTIMASIAELERELIRDRVVAGLKRAKSKGKKLGRPSGSKDKGRRKLSGYYLRWNNAK